MRSFTIRIENAWVIASTFNGRLSFHEVGIAWMRSPTHVPIYPSEECASAVIRDKRHHKRVGFETESEVAPMRLDHAIAAVLDDSVIWEGATDEQGREFR